MSDSSISIVPRQSSYPNNKMKAKEILDCLISEDIIKPELSDCILSSEKGYAISEGAKTITNYPDSLNYDLITNGLRISTDREIFTTGENGIETLICPNCNQNIANEDWNFLNEWFEIISDNLTCPLCKVGTEIHKYNFTPEWGFSDLGFTFWNLADLKEEFIKEFEKKLGCDVSIVHNHI